MKLNKLIKVISGQRYDMTIINPSDTIVDTVEYLHQLPAPSKNYKVIAILPVKDKDELYIHLVIREVVK